MATYLVIQNQSETKSYTCKSSYSTVPYIKVSNSYLNLQETTTTGFHLEVKTDNKTYIPVQSYTTTASRSSEYTETTGYTGVTSRASTSGYSGVLSKKSTSGYSGVLGFSGTVTQAGFNSYITASYKQVNSTLLTGYRISSRNVTTNTTSNTVKPGVYLTNFNYRTKLNGQYKVLSGFDTIMTMNGATASFGNGTGSVKVSINGSRVTESISIKTSSEPYVKFAPADPYFITAKLTSQINTTSFKTNPGLLSTTALTRASNYNTTSAAVGNLSSTTALTRSSAYNTSSSTTNAGISSTTALTETRSRSSEYTTTTE